MTSALLLSQADIAALMTPADYLNAVETGFRLNKLGRAPSPPPMHIPARAGAFHAKGAALDDAQAVVAVKLNGNFPENRALHGLPTIQGVIILCDADNGAVLALMDSIEITLRRTAAASALAAKHLARVDASILAICGCGDQSYAHARALADVVAISKCIVWDADADKAAVFAERAGDMIGAPIAVATSVGEATRSADIVVTCTTVRAPFLTEADVKPGAFIAAVGADSPDKSELAPSLMKKAKVVVDVLDQCLVMGDLHHAVKAGAMTSGDVYADLGAILLGEKPGRTRADDIIVFDSTGAAFQDVASAAAVYARARNGGVGREFVLSARNP